jgi:hypothetical protein
MSCLVKPLELSPVEGGLLHPPLGPRGAVTADASIVDPPSGVPALPDALVAEPEAALAPSMVGPPDEPSFGALGEVTPELMFAEPVPLEPLAAPLAVPLVGPLDPTLPLDAVCPTSVASVWALQASATDAAHAVMTCKMHFM